MKLLLTKRDTTSISELYAKIVRVSRQDTSNVSVLVSVSTSKMVSAFSEAAARRHPLLD